MMTNRNGKIARLSRDVRTQLNQRLDGAEESPELLDWLNALPEVQAMVRQDFSGVVITKQNLSEWRQGGFEEWRARRDLWEDVLEITPDAGQGDETALEGIVDQAAHLLAARFASLVAHWDGKVDDEFETKTKVLNRLCLSIVQLQRGIHQARRDRWELKQNLSAEKKQEQEELKEKLIGPIRDMAISVPRLVLKYGGGTAGAKMAEYVCAVRRGELNAILKLNPEEMAEWREENDLPSPEELDGKTEEEEVGPVAPSRTNGSGKKGGKGR